MKFAAQVFAAFAASLTLLVAGASAQDTDPAGQAVAGAYEGALDLSTGMGPQINFSPVGFRYGTYCGGGVPGNLTPLEESGRGAGRRIGGLLGRGGGNDDAAVDDRGEVRSTRLGELRGNWPATDQLDALCFAHDYCFDVIGHDSAECDQAFTASLAQMIRRYDSAGNAACGNVASMMFIAFLNKPWSVSDLGQIVRLAEIASLYDGSTNEMRSLLTSRLAHSAAGLPSQPGTCGALADESAVNSVLSLFSGEVDAATRALTDDLRGADLVSMVMNQAGAPQNQWTSLATQGGLSASVDQAVSSMMGAPGAFAICSPFLGADTCNAIDAQMVADYAGRRRLMINLARLAAVAEGASNVPNVSSSNPLRQGAGGLIGDILGGN